MNVDLALILLCCVGGWSLGDLVKGVEDGRWPTQPLFLPWLHYWDLPTPDRWTVLSSKCVSIETQGKLTLIRLCVSLQMSSGSLMARSPTARSSATRDSCLCRTPAPAPARAWTGLTSSTPPEPLKVGAEALKCSICLGFEAINI